MTHHLDFLLKLALFLYTFTVFQLFSVCSELSLEHHFQTPDDMCSSTFLICHCYITFFHTFLHFNYKGPPQKAPRAPTPPPLLF